MSDLRESYNLMENVKIFCLLILVNSTTSLRILRYCNGINDNYIIKYLIIWDRIKISVYQDYPSEYM